YQISLSRGFIQYSTGDNKTADQLITEADAKMYIEKEKYKQACFDIQRNYDLGTFIEKNFRLVNTLLQSEEIVISLINKKIQSCDNKEEFNSILIQYKDLIKKKRLQIFG
ncbi:hypothetical protein LCGC14_3150490, partial [marine sediment metagenome]